MTIPLKTCEEHREYVEHLARISFYFARRWLKAKYPEHSMGELIRDHTPLLYHALNYLDNATQWDNPDCHRILTEADNLSLLSPDEFEDGMWEFIHPLARERAVLNYPDSVGIKVLPGWNCGSLKYDPPQTGIPPTWCTVHILNAVGPYSLFDDPEYLPACFQLLMKEGSIRFGYDTLYCGSWLNHRADWLSFFPEEWRSNLSPLSPDPVPRWHFGWWGQLVTGRGTVNPKAEIFVRENGYLKYQYRTSHCSFENMKRHLAEINKTAIDREEK